MVAADPRVVAVSADRAPPPAPAASMLRRAAIKLAEACQGIFSTFYTDRHWTNTSAVQGAAEAPALRGWMGVGWSQEHP